MTSLVVRRLLIDLAEPFARDWNGGDAFRTAYFNALSMSFPVGEQLFIDSLRSGIEAMPPETRRRFADEVQAFVGQEATHCRIHALFNAHLAAQGHVNAWEGRIRRRLARLDGAEPRHLVAVTAATEHLTAILSEHLLSHTEALDGAEPRLKTLWLWHAAEETEHRSTAFDVYRALGGNDTWRRRWFGLVSVFFTIDVMRQTLRNLQHEGQLWRWSSWRSGAAFLFGRRGVVRNTFGPWRAYLRADFHPSQSDPARSQQWLQDHASQYRAVGESSPA